MTDKLARIADCVAELNSIMNTISDNDTVEFNIDNRLQVLETAVDDLTTDVETTAQFNKETSG